MTVIIPVDFSAQSINAASFASKMLTGAYGTELLLYHLHPEDADAVPAYRKLQKIKESLQQTSIIKIRCLAEKGTRLVDALCRLINKEDAGLVVMSVSDRVKLFEDSYSLQMMAQGNCPVMVIPYGYLYNDVRTVALASDFRDVDKTVPVAKVKKVLNLFRPKLHVVHISPQAYVSPNGELAAQRLQLEETFAEFGPEFHFISAANFTEGLERFIEDKSVDLVLTFPRKHGFFASLIKSTNTKKLVYKNAVPVLAAHE